MKYYKFIAFSQGCKPNTS